ncbi:DMT family transporter [Sphingoaurantiacus capsulatus]|uniref:DMT family transporter n=1 Tax=Sphingoaurantiacus capsulatus TaxID=1771310 RepID=A0ABV7XDG6_9SPHN
MIPPAHFALIALIDIVWAFNMIAIKYAMDEVSPLVAVFLRYAIVLMVCAPWLRWLPGRMTTILLTGLFGGALYFGIGGVSIAITENVSALAIVGQLSVPFSLILAVIFLKERIRWPRILGVTLSFLGVVILGFDPTLVHEWLGIILTVIATFLYAISSLLMRKLKGVHPLNIHAWLALISLPLLAGASLIFEPGSLARVGDIRLGTVGWLAYSAIGASVIGHAGMSWLLQKHPVSVIAPLTLPTPLLTVALGVMLLDTPITPQLLAGGLVALVGVSIVTLRTARAQVREGQ